jgi:tRNA pseudouridine38-40 synthase
MNNNKLTIQYDGTKYAGWQIQSNALTVQEVIKNSISQIIREEINLIGAGRTDAGVHALGQVANFKSDKELDLRKFKYSLNSVLPDDISISNAELVSEDFHSRYSAQTRSYVYLITGSKSPFYHKYSHSFYSELNVEKLNQISLQLIGSKDYSSFSKTNTDVQNKICEVYQARWRKEKNLIIFYIEANRFLYGMVRAIVGTLLKASNIENAETYLEEVFLSKNRADAADAVPAKGLFLYKIKY